MGAMAPYPYKGEKLATGKRYYWIKLREDFMKGDAIDFLMSQKNGAEYVVLYQMLCMATMNTGGGLLSVVGEFIIPFDVDKIQRETKWFSPDTICVALELYKKLGLIYQSEDGYLVISQYNEVVGSESDYAAQKRLQRSEKKALMDKGVDNVHTDIRDKSKDIRDNNNICVVSDEKGSSFEEFWKIYPRKKEKQRAYKQYCARIKDGWSHEELMEAVTGYADECRKKSTPDEYIKHGATFLSANTPFADYLKKKKESDVVDDGRNPFTDYME